MFKFGSKSKSNLYMVHSALVNVTEEAISISSQDFGIYEGLRTIEKERENIRKGTSKLTNPRNCKHCPQFDGFSHAVDAVPFVDGAYQWTWAECYKIALAFRTVALRRAVLLRWGGVWDRSLNSLSNDLDKEVDEYRERFESTYNKRAFLDGVHFEFIFEPINPINTGNDKALIA